MSAQPIHRDDRPLTMPSAGPALTQALDAPCPHCHGQQTRQVAFWDQANDRAWLAECLECGAMGKPQLWITESEQTSVAIVLLTESDVTQLKHANDARQAWIAAKGTPGEAPHMALMMTALAQITPLLPALANPEYHPEPSQ